MTAFVTVAVLLAAIAGARGTWSPCGLSMIAAINPMSERARGHRFGLTAGWFFGGALIGGAALGASGALGAWLVDRLAVPSSWLAVVAAACCLVCLVSDAGERLGTRFRLPDHPRQVNERWLESYRRWVYAGGFGAQIGVGFATYIMTAAVYLVPVLGALSGSTAVALTLGLTFGAVRGAAVLLTLKVHEPAALFALHRRLDTWAASSRTVAASAMAVAAVSLASLGLGVLGGGLVAALIAGAGVLVRAGGAAPRSERPPAAPHEADVRTADERPSTSPLAGRGAGRGR